MVLHLLILNCIWPMQFNVNKCSIMSVGKGNMPVDYTLNDTTLGKSYSVSLEAAQRRMTKMIQRLSQ